jgi:hypothetical protein
MPDELLDNVIKCDTLVFLSGGVQSPNGEAPRQQRIAIMRYQTAFTLEAVFCPHIVLGESLIYNTGEG